MDIKLCYQIGFHIDSLWKAHDNSAAARANFFMLQSTLPIHWSFYSDPKYPRYFLP